MVRKKFLIIVLIFLMILGIYWLLFKPGPAVKVSSPEPYNTPVPHNTPKEDNTPKKIWKPKLISKEYLFTLKGHNAPVTCLAFSPDGKFLASAAKDVIDESDYTRDNFTYKDEVIRVWDTAQRNLVWHSSARGSVSGVSFIPGGEVMAITHVKSDIHVDKEVWAKRWNSKDGKTRGAVRLRHVSLRAYKDVDYDPARLQPWDDAAFSPDGAMVAVGWSIITSGSVMCEEGTFSVLSTVDLRPLHSSKYMDFTGHVCQGFSGNCRTFFSGTAGLMNDSPAAEGDQLMPSTTLEFYEVSGWKSPGSFGFENKPSCIAISPSGKTLLVGTAVRRGTLFHLNVELIKKPQDIPRKDYTENQVLSTGRENYTSAAFSPDGAYAAAGDDNGDVHLFSTTDWRPLAIINAHEGGVTSLAFSPNSKILASGGEDKMIRLLDIAHILIPSPSASPMSVQSPSVVALANAPLLHAVVVEHPDKFK
ncbi:MAG: hypothetical protein M1269_07175 [Chloroflexi bacterium]|nr:hypothetical protein [Chloroflexota bacterium]